MVDASGHSERYSNWASRKTCPDLSVAGFVSFESRNGPGVTACYGGLHQCHSWVPYKFWKPRASFSTFSAFNDRREGGEECCDSGCRCCGFRAFNRISSETGDAAMTSMRAQAGRMVPQTGWLSLSRVDLRRNNDVDWPSSIWNFKNKFTARQRNCYMCH